MDELSLVERVKRIEKYLAIQTEDIGEEEKFVAVEGVWDGDAQQELNRRRSAAIQPGATAFEDIVNRIQASNDRVCRSAGRLEDIGDRILGSAPMEATGKTQGAERGPDGTLDHTMLELNFLDGSLDRLERAVLRLERV